MIVLELTKLASILCYTLLKMSIFHNCSVVVFWKKYHLSVDKQKLTFTFLNLMDPHFLPAGRGEIFWKRKTMRQYWACSKIWAN